MSARRVGPPTKLPAAVLDAIREAIISGRYQPGERLTETQLAAEHNVSRVPVREALRSLESEGFVRIAPYSGTFVAKLSAQEGEDLLEVRAALEVVAARRAAERCSGATLDALSDVMHESEQARAAGDYATLIDLNGRFHLLVAEASCNSSVHQLLEQLRAKIAWVYAADVRDRAEASWHEHGDLVHALRRGAADHAAQIMEVHLSHARVAYRRRWSADA